MSAPDVRIYVAIDTPDLDEARRLARLLAGLAGGFKLGLEYFVANGPEGVRAVVPEGTPLFLDLKLHDIPNTVAGAVRSAIRLIPRLITLHASASRAVLAAARTAAEEESVRLGVQRPKLLGVTVLTSLEERDLAEVGQQGPIADQALRLAKLAMAAGLDGVVCSAHEVAAVRNHLGRKALLVVPGVRPAWAEAGDQKRIATPREALAAGADTLVIGRPVTRAADPRAALSRILDEIAASG